MTHSASLQAIRQILASSLLALLLPALAQATDSYTPAGSRLAVPALQIGGVTCSNVVLTVGRVVSGPTAPPAHAGVDSG